MKPPEISTMVRAITDAIVPSLREQLLRDVDGRIDSFRRSVYVREEWCCNEMGKFAVAVWGASKPKTNIDSHFGNVSYQLRGHHVNYCPFCGVAFTPVKSA